jgi:hypothetical protein
VDAGRVGRPIHGVPSTHIIKVDDGRQAGLIAAEATCLSLTLAPLNASLAAAVRSCEHPQVAELVASNVERLRR